MEIEKVELLAFFHQAKQSDFEFPVDLVCEWFERLGVHQPNKSRLNQNIRRSRSFINGKTKGTFRLHGKAFQELQEKYPIIKEENEEIVADGLILPNSLFQKTRGYIESLAKQINASYEHNIFDGCAVIMRRLLEICLIHAYENAGIDSIIRNAQGFYRPLGEIINNAIGNPTLSLSKTTESCLNDFRVIGNYSAHKIYYNARKGDIKKIIIEYRATIEELLYKAGIKK